MRPVRLAYQPPASSTFLSEQTIHQQPASSTFLSEQISTSHQPQAKRTGLHLEISIVVMFLEHLIFEAPILTPLYPYYLHILFYTKY
jgi:hypothetical protein